MRNLPTGIVRACVGLALALPLPQPGWAQNFSAAETARLPPYCQGDPASRKHWGEVYGPPFDHIHHHCWGLGYLNLARAAIASPDRQKRGYYLTEAISNFMYSINAWPQDFVLLPDAYLGVGNAQRMLGQEAKAMGSFAKAISLKPDYAPAYAAMSDIWIDRGQKDKAKEILRDGVRNAPDAKGLTRRLAELEAETSRAPPARGATKPSQ